MAKGIDWKAVEREYRAGIRSLRDIGAEFGCSEAAIRKRAKAEEWERDLTARIEAKTEALVRKSAAVRTKVRSEEELANDEAIVEANAQVRAEAINSQAASVQRNLTLAEKLFEELDAQVDGREYIDQMIEVLSSDEGTEKLAQLARKVTSLPSHVDTYKKLVDAHRVGVELQRKVLRIKDDTSADDMLKKIGEGAGMSAMDAYRRMCDDLSAS